ncbi:hypothetical protein F5B20DRAFT_591452 [Whalleya microplaca]|nr:hypothetical protein F5B20DRAFT_591452 [Whalleya microplaca]
MPHTIARSIHENDNEPIWNLPQLLYLEDPDIHERILVTGGGIVHYKETYYILTAKPPHARKWRHHDGTSHYNCHRLSSPPINESNSPQPGRIIGQISYDSETFAYVLIALHVDLYRGHEEKIQQVSMQVVYHLTEENDISIEPIKITLQGAGDLSDDNEINLVIKTTKGHSMRFYSGDCSTSDHYCHEENFRFDNGTFRVAICDPTIAYDCEEETPKPEDCGSWIYKVDDKDAISEPHRPYGMLFSHIEDHREKYFKIIEFGKNPVATDIGVQVLKLGGGITEDALRDYDSSIAGTCEQYYVMSRLESLE